MSRLLRTPLFLASLLALPALVWASASGHAIWSKIDLEALTHLGTVRFQATTSGKGDAMKLDQVDIRLAGRRIPLPRNADIRVSQPQLHELQIVHTASVICIDGCPDVSTWPVTVSLPFGERVGHHADVDDDDEARPEVCHRSLLRLDFTADGFDSIEIWTCNPESGDFDIRVLVPAAGEADTRK